MTNTVYQNDLPDGLNLGPMVAIDCETMGLHPHRDRLGVIPHAIHDHRFEVTESPLFHAAPLLLFTPTS